MHHTEEADWWTGEASVFSGAGWFNVEDGNQL